MMQEAPQAVSSGWDPEMPTWLAGRMRVWLEPLTINPWLQALAAVLGALVLAKLTDWAVTIGVRAFTRRTRTELDDQILAFAHAPLIWSITVLGFAVAGRLVIPNDGGASFTEHVLLTVTVLVWLIFGLRTCALLLRAAARHPTRFVVLHGPAFPLFDNAARLVVYFVGAWTLISVWGLDTTGWLASAGILGIALGFAAQETLANLFSGVFILADKPYKAGDFIVLDSGERGVVTRIGLRSTRMLTPDDVEIIIPNLVMGQAKIINQTGGPDERVRVGNKIGVAYGSSVPQVRQVLLQAAAACPLAEKSPEPVVRFTGFGDSSLDFQLYIWVRNPLEQVAATDDLLERAYDALNRAGVTIPFPQRDLWIRSETGAVKP